jgi:DNA-binding SARP family transcriptional activator
MHLRLLGRFELRHGDVEVRLAPVGERLLAYLGLRGVTPRDAVAFRLWADHSEEHALACLRSTLWRLPKPDGAALVCTDNARVRLADHVEVDIAHRRREVATWANGEPMPPGLTTRGFTADVLPGWYDDWLVLDRERHRQMRLHLLERMSTWLAGTGCYGEAIAAALEAVAADPLRESAHRCVVAAHLAEGNLHEAVRQTRHYLALLDDAGLPATPSPALRRLMPLVSRVS